MRVLIAPDKLKGTLGAAEAAAAIARGVARVFPDATVVELPLADGGEGTLDVAVAAGGRSRRAASCDPWGRPVDAPFVVLRNEAVLEAARAAAPPRGPRPGAALRASSAGVGLLIRAAERENVAGISVGVGGSMWTDGGTGAASAFGWRFLDRRGHPLAPGGGALARLHSVEAGETPRLPAVALCDVDNALVGPAGAARVFAPQKGASPSEVERLEAGLERLVAITGISGDLPMSGAGGGLAWGLAGFLGARLERGFDRVASWARLEQHLATTDLVITGEGRFDAGSLGGKTPVAVARAARAAGVPVVLIAGALEGGRETWREQGFAAALSLTDLAGERALMDASGALEEAAEVLARRVYADGSGDTGRT
ncbi:MAG TPA: glycerate kinase [Actinomycetota bacterium]|nr:glycerate kinase [Actinomycetota bacterium]